MSKKIDAISGVISLLGVMRDSALGREVPGREDVFQDKVGDQTIDTCCAFDTATWETGIERNDNWIIVEQYDDREAAEAGHKAWVAKLTANPTIELSDVNVWNL